jgi:hypothetical protein
VTDSKRLVGLGQQEEANVEVKMGGLAGPRGDRMNVQIEQRQTVGSGHALELLHPGLLAGLAKGNLEDIAVTVCVPSQLEPTPELAMVGEQKISPVVGDDPARGGDVSRLAAAFETIRMPGDEVPHLCDAPQLLGMALPVAIQQLEQIASMHASPPSVPDRARC